MTLVGETIQMRLAIWGNPADPNPPAAEQTVCYTATYPALYGVVLMLPTSTLHTTRRIPYYVQLTAIGLNQFSIQIRFLMQMDEKDFSDGLSYASINRFEKNAIDNPLFDDNTVPSVYNEMRQLKMEVTNWDGTDAESAIYKADFNARFWCFGDGCCSDYMECIVDPVSDWSYQLYRDDAIVSGFSAYENTTIKFQANFNAGNTPSRYHVGIYRKDSFTNNSVYWTGITFSYAVFNPTMAGLSPSPFGTAAFAPGGAAMTNLVDNIWEAEVEFNASFFAPNGTYRAFFVVLDDTDNFYSCNTLDIVADGCPPANLADITVNSWQYGSMETTYTADTLINVATRGRVKINMIFDKASYNSNLATNGYPGSFNANIKTFGTRVMDAFPSVPKTLIPTNELPLTVISESASIERYTVEFQVPEEWSGQVKYIVFMWNFDITIGGNTCQQQLRKVVKLQMRINDEDLTNYFVPTMTDQNDEVIPLDEVCADDVETIELCFAESLESNYDFIQITRNGDSGLYSENDEYAITELDVVLNPLIQFADADTDTGSGCMTLNLEDFPINTPIYLGGVFISKAVESIDECNDIDYSATTTLISQNEFQSILSYEYDLAPLLDADVLQVEVNYDANGEGWVTEVFVGQAEPENPLYITITGDPALAIISFSILITLTNGCQYESTYTFILALSELEVFDLTELTLSPIGVVS
jgi:hypothetical protein